MPPKKLKETENTVKQGNTNKNCYWANMKAYQMLPNNEIIFAGGGIEIEGEIETVRAFCVRNKKTYNTYENVFNIAEKAYSKVTFGKFAQRTTQEIFLEDKNYANWLYKNVTDETIKKELKELLKIK